MSRRSALAWLSGLMACAPSRGSRPARCGEAFGGNRLTRPDGVQLWFKVLGPPGAKALLHLHGGPGHHAYDFEAAVGTALARQLRLILVDQRGCGRTSTPSSASLGMAATVADLEALRRHLGIERWSVLGHSFGGAVAVSLLRTAPSTVSSAVLVETNADFDAAMQRQLDTLVAVAPARFPEASERLRALASSPGATLERVLEAYELVGVQRAMRAVQFASDEAHGHFLALEEEARLAPCADARRVEALRAEGFLGAGQRRMLEAPLPVPSVVIAGRTSGVVGPELASEAARGWGSRLEILEHSAHFPYLEEPERFVELVLSHVVG